MPFHTPDPNDPAWQVSHDPILPDPVAGSTLDHLEDRRAATSLDGWSEVPLPEKVKADAAVRLLNTLNESRIRVRRIEFRRAGIFSPGMMRVRLAVPDECLSYAARIAGDILSGK